MENSENNVNRFEVSIALSKRARQIKEGAVPLVDVPKNINNPLTIALEEYNSGKLIITRKNSSNNSNDEQSMEEFMNENDDLASQVVVETEEPKKKVKK